jgi:predicted dehydrogenase
MTGQRRPLKVGIIGLAHLHPRSYVQTFAGLPDTRVVAAMDPDRRLRDAFCRESGVRGYATLEDLLRNEDPDIAAIFLPHADCPEAAVKCGRQRACE